jgi:hypothetical protein
MQKMQTDAKIRCKLILHPLSPPFPSFPFFPPYNPLYIPYYPFLSPSSPVYMVPLSLVFNNLWLTEEDYSLLSPIFSLLQTLGEGGLLQLEGDISLEFLLEVCKGVTGRPGRTPVHPSG